MKINDNTKCNVQLLIVGVLLVMLLFSGTLAAEMQSTLTAKEILKRSDKVRNPDTPFSTHLTLTEYKQAKEVDEISLRIYSKKQKDNGQYRNLVKFLTPKRDAGKKLLQNGNEIWFYDPSAKNSIRMSAQQRLMGQASNGDVMTANFALDYQVELLGEDVIKDTRKNPREVYHLYLTAKNSDVTYEFTDFWVEKDSFRPIKSKFYSRTKRLMKIVYYTHFEQQLGRVRPTQVLIIDGLDPRKVTRLKMKNYQAVTIPEAWFQRSYLPRFKG